jgi:ABC-type branched-subunit amino acid transport system substrate-binding protein
VTTLGTTTWRAESTLLAIQKFYPNAKRVGLVAEQDATLDQLQPVFQKIAGNLGMQLDVQAVPTGTTDYTSALTNLKAKNPDIIIGIDNNPEQNAAIIRANNEIAAAPALFGYSGSCPQAVQANTAVPFIGQTFVGADLDYPTTDAAKKFSATFKDWSKDAKPQLLYSSLWNYDFYFLLQKAMEKAGTVEDTAKIYDALFDVSYDGVVGHIQFDRTTKQARYGYVMCYTDGKTIDPSKFQYIDPQNYDLAALEK